MSGVAVVRTVSGSGADRISMNKKSARKLIGAVNTATRIEMIIVAYKQVGQDGEEMRERERHVQSLRLRSEERHNDRHRILRLRAPICIENSEHQKGTSRGDKSAHRNKFHRLHHQKGTEKRHVKIGRKER
jgi:hypothetical protein